MVNCQRVDMMRLSKTLHTNEGENQGMSDKSFVVSLIFFHFVYSVL